MGAEQKKKVVTTQHDYHRGRHLITADARRGGSVHISTPWSRFSSGGQMTSDTRSRLRFSQEEPQKKKKKKKSFGRAKLRPPPSLFLAALGFSFSGLRCSGASLVSEGERLGWL